MPDSSTTRPALRRRPASKLTARCAAEVVRLEEGARYHIVPVPEAVAAEFRAARIRRLICTINGHTLKRALQNHADGGSFVIIGQPKLAELGLKRGTRVVAELRADPEPDALDVPEELALVLAQDEPARTRWATFTLGRQRSLIHYVASAKQEPTRIKRSLELARKIRQHQLYSDR